MPPGLFIPPTLGQNDTSMRPQQSVSVTQPIAPDASISQQTDQVNVSASQSMIQQQHLASLIQPITPTEVLVSRLPHQNRVNWVLNDPVVGNVRQVNVPHAHPLAR